MKLDTLFKWTIIIFIISIFYMLISIRVAIEKWGSEIMMNKVTVFEQHHNYDVQSYGVIKLNDELAGVDYVKENAKKP